MKKALLFLFALLAGSKATFSKQFYGNEARALIANARMVVTDDSTQMIKMVEFEPDHQLPKDSIEHFLVGFGKKFLPGVELRFDRQETDNAGFTVRRYRLYLNGFPVEWGVLKLHIAPSGYVRIINGELYKPIQSKLFSGRIQPPQIQAIIQDYYVKQKLSDNSPILLQKIDQVFFPRRNDLIAAYKVEVFKESSPEPFRRWIFISSEDGSILSEHDRIIEANSNGTAVTMYSGTKSIVTDSLSPTSFRLKESGAVNVHTQDLNNGTSYLSAVDFTDADNYWNNTANFDLAANDVHYGSEKTYNYFLSNFLRNSYDNAGATINSFVHYSTAYVNAFWDGYRLTYGDGDGINYGPLTSTDVVAHEITHAVTQYTAGLTYAYESGALNESFSDIFGVAVDYYANPTTANFIMGDQFAYNNMPFRNMQNPNATGQPDTYLGLYWYSGSGDNGGVHTNSQVQNYWFYLLCTGGSGINDNSVSFNVVALGMTKAQSIAYRTLTQYLTSNSQYADARLYSIQSAIDLYGNCSNEVVQVTNAWHAVGVGSAYNSGLNANFTANQTSFCASPATVSFNNLSSGATTYSWNFGDGGTSTSASPTHTYVNTGNYTVTLIITGTSACGTADTLIMPNYIQVSNVGVPTAATCSPAATFPSSFSGITNVQLDSINNTSGTAIEGYKDFTCSKRTTLTVGSQYLLKVTSAGSNDNVKIWLDQNNNGIFSTSEVVGSFNASTSPTNQVVFAAPSSPLLNTPLRLRIISDNSSFINTACQIPSTGQYEDYSVIFKNTSTAPTANFAASSQTVNIGGTINFTDLSLNGPTSWQWTINGGTPSFSALQNPSASFSSVGTYLVKLKVTNTFGADSAVQTIQVVSSVTMCATANQTTTGTSGLLYDSGGPTGSYQDYENCSLLINPGTCTDSIKLSFSAFSTESCCDHLTVYDGANASAPVLLYASGYSIPGTIKATSGKMFITWNTDGSVVGSGFAANWTAYQSTSTPPNANYTFTPSTPALMDTVFFTNTSTGPSISGWSWDFGDGQSSVQQHPKHVYSQPGTYTVRLITFSCNSSDTVLQNITTQVSPNVIFTPATLSATMGCNDTADLSLIIGNTAGGTLLWNTNQVVSGPNNVLTWLYGVDSVQEWTNLRTAINQHFTNYNLTTTTTSSSTTLQSLLSGKSVLIIPEVESTSALSSVFTSAAPVIQSFVQNGGTVIVFHDLNNKSLFNIGIFTGNNLSSWKSSGNLQVANTATPLTSGVSSSTVAIANSTNPVRITNSNKITVLKDPFSSTSDTDVVTIVPYGSGRGIYIGYDFYNYNNDIGRIAANAVSWGINGYVGSNKNVVIIPSSGSVSASSQDTVLVRVFSKGLSGGLDTLYAHIYTNDTAHVHDSIPIYVTVTSLPCVNFSAAASGGCSGNVSFTDSTTHNPTSWLWSFGDGSTSTVQNPSHIYAVNGNYTVKLKVTNAFGTDSLTKSVTITGAGGPLPSSCFIPTNFSSVGDGVTSFSLNTINQISGDASEGYKDYTCTQATTLVKGSAYSFSIASGNLFAKNMIVALDLNNDGIFVLGEKIKDTFLNYGTSFITFNYTVPNSMMTNTPLRMRVISCQTGSFYGFCQPMSYGQAEDFSVTFIPPTPQVAFTGTPLLAFVNQSIQLTDQTTNAPTSWNWSMPGATPVASTMQHPSIVYTVPGFYNIKLTATNTAGTDSLTKNNYVQVATLPSLTTGYLNSDCNKAFMFFTQRTNPFTTVYWNFGDGVTITSSSDTVAHNYVAAGTYSVMMVAQSPYGNDTNIISVKVFNWNVVILHSGVHIVNSNINFSFAAPGATPASVLWNFGDGNNSQQINPVHAYQNPGTYVVTLSLFDSVNSCYRTIYDSVIITTTSVENVLPADIRVYPNPFTNLIVFEFDRLADLGQAKIQLLNLLGQPVNIRLRTAEANKLIFETDDLAAGIYMLEVGLDDKRYYLKLRKSE